MNKAIAAVHAMNLEKFTDMELASLNNAVTGFGKVDPNNHGFSKALELGLIDSKGLPIGREEVEAACSVEIQQRLKAGGFK